MLGRKKNRIKEITTLLLSWFLETIFQNTKTHPWHTQLLISCKDLTRLMKMLRRAMMMVKMMKMMRMINNICILAQLMKIQESTLLKKAPFLSSKISNPKRLLRSLKVTTKISKCKLHLLNRTRLLKIHKRSQCKSPRLQQCSVKQMIYTQMVIYLMLLNLSKKRLKTTRTSMT